MHPSTLGLLALLALSFGTRPPAAGADAPPFQAGVKLYRVEFSRPTSEVLPELGPATALEVVEVRGSWALLASPGIPRGPMWVNFDQVVRFSFER